MNELITDEVTFKSDLFATMPLGVEGAADGYPVIDAVFMDEELTHSDWPHEPSVRRAARHILGSEAETSWGVASLGYTVYRALQDEDHIPEAVYLDSRCFLPETNLLDVLDQAAHCAIDDQALDLVAPIISGLLDTAAMDLQAAEKIQKYLDTVIRSADAASLRLYVNFVNANTVKSSESSKVLLRQMAHAIQNMPIADGWQSVRSRFSQLDKQLLLEDIGHAWIRKAMPVAEIDWLP